MNTDRELWNNLIGSHEAYLSAGRDHYTRVNDFVTQCHGKIELLRREIPDGLC